jgi:hypothetical protein
VARLLGNVVPCLMVTDPPYGVSYDPAWRAAAGVNRNTKKLGTVANDDNADWTDAWRLFAHAVFSQPRETALQAIFNRQASDHPATEAITVPGHHPACIQDVGDRPQGWC